MSLPIISKSELNISGHTVRPYMQPGEENVLLALIDSCAPESMIEIGVNEGRTARSVLDQINSIKRYIGIDVSREYKFEIPLQQCERPSRPGHLALGDPRFELVLRDAGVSLEDIASTFGIKGCDVVFIDGDHGRRTVLEDSMQAAKIVMPCGMIIWHDYGNTTVQVTEVLDQLWAGGRDIYHVANTWLAFEHQHR